MNRINMIGMRKRELLETIGALTTFLADSKEDLEKWNDDPPAFFQLNDARLYRLTGEILQASKNHDNQIAMYLAEQKEK
jgi:hypothetical protein